MPFASFKNAQKRYARIHKERAQPERRKRLGILPKKQDFIKRARAKENKDSKMKELRRLALTKNEDEFYFNMVNSRCDPEKGHIPLNVVKEYSDSALESGLSASISQLRFELQKERAQIRKLEASANLLQGDYSLRSRRAPPKHTIFVESAAEAAQVRSRITSGTIACPSSMVVPDDISEEQVGLYTELEQRIERASAIQVLLKKREAKQILARNRNKKYRVELKERPNVPPVYKFELTRNR